jgi:hypothetical protein
MTTSPFCCVCKQPTEPQNLRPYGPKGKPICQPCGTSPAHVHETQKRLKAFFKKRVGNSVPVFTADGPRAMEDVPWNEVIEPALVDIKTGKIIKVLSDD